MKNKIIDLFCGCGGLSLGFENAGFDVCCAIDLWDKAIQTYNYNRKNVHAECLDIRELSKARLCELNSKSEIIGIIGGPPCQGFSKVGTRSIDDARNHLYLEYCRIVEEIQPEFFVLENVSGILSLCGGMFRNNIIKRFEELGYVVNYKELCAANFGVPQNRRRVFFVGMKKYKFEFPNEHNDYITSSDAISDLPPLNVLNGLDNMHIYTMLPQNDYQKKLRGDMNEVSNHQITMHSQQTIDIIKMVPDGGTIYDIPNEYWNIRKYRKGFERMPSNKPCHTVDTGHRNYFHYCENRIPTARENARLQSFPDNYVFLGTKTDQYKQIGNAVPPLLAYHVAKAIKNQL